jgi:hypothetical protein
VRANRVCPSLRYVWGCAVAALFSAGAADASFHLFRISEIYSSADGTVQFVEITESTGSDFESFWAGQTLRSSQGATARTFTFPTNLPSTNTANRSVIVATPGFAAAAGITPDFVVPAPFLFPNGGSINYANVDIVSYGPLPTDGVTSIDRNDVLAANTPTNFAGQTGSIAPPPPVPPPAVAPSVDIPALSAPGLAVMAMLVAAAAALTMRAGSGRRRTTSSPTRSP